MIIEKLQGIGTDLAKVMSDIKLLKETLKELRAIADMHHAICFREFKNNAEGSATETAMTKWSEINIIRNLFQLHS